MVSATKARDGTDRWFEYDDEMVTPRTPDHIERYLTSGDSTRRDTAYILSYRMLAE